MPEKTVIEKLLLKPGERFMLLQAPAGYLESLGALPAGVSLTQEPAGQADVIQVFVSSQRDVEKLLAGLKPLLAQKGRLWVTYGKQTARKKSDANRDTIRLYAETVGLEGVAIFSVDADWSALRLKPVG